MRYRVVVNLDGSAFVERRSGFPWSVWRRAREWYCSGFDIEPRDLSFPDAESALRWANESAKA